VSLKIWRFPAGGGQPVQCGPEFTATGSGPAYLAFSPDGQKLAVALRQSYVSLFSVPSLDDLAEIKSAPGLIYGLGFSPDSQTVFTIDYDGFEDGHLYADRVDGTAITSRILVSIASCSQGPASIASASAPARRRGSLGADGSLAALLIGRWLPVGCGGGLRPFLAGRAPSCAERVCVPARWCSTAVIPPRGYPGESGPLPAGVLASTAASGQPLTPRRHFEWRGHVVD